ncbi:MAG TPA: right-handed parallel beta-helix repeat-containing protein [Steroidobacteraceae bacterium]|nr:right-handed parallel beta-helix repeat-containing protein [Steroidobacteraceae bacterium]
MLMGLCAGVRCAEAQSGGVCEATVYGVSTSSTDNTAALTNALQACQGRTLHLAAGTYRFAPGQFVRGIFVPDATSIVGDGASTTTLLISGPGNYDSFFWIVDVSNVSIRGLTLQGNGTPYQAGSCTYDYGRAISIYANAALGRPVVNVSIASNLLRNFVGSGWISIYAAPHSGGVGTIPAGANISVQGNFFQSVPGNSVAPGNPDCNSSAVQIFGGSTTPNVSNISVFGNGFDTSYLKQGIIVYGSANEVTIAANSISGTGEKLPSSKDSSLYGVIIYQKDLPPNFIDVIGNKIIDPFSCGVYVAAGRNITINGNTISGQIDTNDGIEPKGAICLNQMDNGHDGESATVLGNTITHSHVGISIARGRVPNVRQNTISEIPAGGIGIKVAADAGTSISLIDNSVSSTSQHVTGLLGSGTSPSLSIRDLFVTGAAYPTRWFRDPDGAQPICKFSDVGTIVGIFERNTSSLAFTAQSVLSPDCH